MKEDYWVIIVNPVAGRGRAVDMARDLMVNLKARSNSVEMVLTEEHGHGEEIASHAVREGATKIVACGGDGTVHEVVNGLMRDTNDGHETALGVLPAGRCNDLNYALDFPEKTDAIKYMPQGIVKRIDLGRIGSRYFATIATLGFDSAVSQYVDEGRPPSFLRGTTAYLYGALVQLLSYRDKVVRLTGDFGEFHGEIFLAATGNTTRYGGRMKITPSASAEDGLLDLCLVRPPSRWDVLRMIPKTFSGDHVSHRSVTMYRTGRLTIESDEELWVWADGERITLTPATIEVAQKSLPILVPPWQGNVSSGL